MANQDSNTGTSNINEATVEQIESLPFMNTQRARLITDYIASNGPLTDMSQVDNITGIGDKLSELLKQHFNVGNSGGNNRNQGGGGNHGNANK